MAAIEWLADIWPMLDWWGASIVAEVSGNVVITSKFKCASRA